MDSLQTWPPQQTAVPPLVLLAERGIELATTQQGYTEEQYRLDSRWIVLIDNIKALSQDSRLTPLDPIKNGLDLARTYYDDDSYARVEPATLRLLSTHLTSAVTDRAEQYQHNPQISGVAKDAISLLTAQAAITEGQRTINDQWRKWSQDVRCEVPNPTTRSENALHTLNNFALRQASGNKDAVPHSSTWESLRRDTLSEFIEDAEHSGVNINNIDRLTLSPIAQPPQEALAFRAMELARNQARLISDKDTFFTEWVHLGSDITMNVPYPPQNRLSTWLHKTNDLYLQHVTAQAHGEEPPSSGKWTWLATGLETALHASDRAKQDISPVQDKATNLLAQAERLYKHRQAFDNSNATAVLLTRDDVQALMDSMYGKGYGSNLLRQYERPALESIAPVSRNLSDVFTLQIERPFPNQPPTYSLRITEPRSEGIYALTQAQRKVFKEAYDLLTSIGNPKSEKSAEPKSRKTDIER